MSVKKSTILILILTLLFSLSACSDSGTGSEGSTQDSGTAAAFDNQGTILTVSGYGDETSFTLSDLEELGTATYSFSGRNKENNNERQIREYKGIELLKVLEKAGYGKAGETLLITCSDGYTREYALDDLNDLLFFEDKVTEKGEVVPTILAIMNEGEDIGNDKTYSSEEGSPLRLVFGQADYDSDYTKDFNMQGWASYVEKIEVKEGSDQ